MQTDDGSAGRDPQAAAITGARAHGAQRRNADARARHPRRRAARDRRALRRTSRLARPLLPGRQDTTHDRSDRRRLAELSAEVDQTLTQAKTFPEAIGAIVAPWRRLLVDHDFALGCPLAATVVDAADNDELRVHANELLARWQASVADVYAKFGDPPIVAEEQATVLLAAIEGALILARARRSTEPLDTVERYFASRPPGPEA